MHKEKMRYLRDKARVFLEVLRRDYWQESVPLAAECVVTEEPITLAETGNAPGCIFPDRFRRHGPGNGSSPG